MKSKQNMNIIATLRIFAVLTIVLLSGGCVREQLLDSAGNGDETLVSFTLQLPYAARSLSFNDENVVSEIDILMFDGTTGDYFTTVSRTGAQITTDGTDPRKKSFTVRIRQGSYDLMILANARSIIGSVALSGKSKATVSGALLTAMPAGGKWLADTSVPGYRHIPMWGNVGTLNIGETTSLTEGNAVKMTRMIARADVQVSGMAASNFQLAGVYLYNYNTEGRLVPIAGNWNATTQVPIRASVPASSALTPGPLLYDGAAISGNACVGEVYLFEAQNLLGSNPAEPKAYTNRTCLVVGGKWDAAGDGDFSDDPISYYRMDFSTGAGASESFLNVLRNHHYTFDISKVAEGGHDTPDEAFRGVARLTATVTPWNLAEQNAAYGQYSLNVSQSEFEFASSGGTLPLTAETNYNISSQGFPAGLSMTVAYDGPDSGWLTINNTVGADGDLSRSVTLQAASSSNPQPRLARVLVTAGNLTKVVHVEQIPGIPDGFTNTTITLGRTYVGAFWRADQTGERLIRIPITAAGSEGEWTAQVYQYGDFAPGDIVLSTTNSNDPDIYTDNAADMSTNDAKYSVSGNATYVKGTVSVGGDIFFRIGLRSKWSTNPAYNASTKPARYAVVVISCNNNTKYQPIYLRQGHEPDYVMRPGDTDGSGAAIADNRSYARKFSPYNLSAEGYRVGASSATFIQLNPRGGVFTNYPSQAGAFFQWANATTIRYAYNPISPTGAINGWQNNYPNTYWSTLGITYETCPPNYRRPADGTISAANPSGAVASSEMRQSLWLNPQASAGVTNLDNSVWGYYADGFFDRRQIVTPGGGNPIAASAVAANTVSVAYIGRLFFNSDAASPSYNASLFIPAVGSRSNFDGGLNFAGSLGYYWTSSASSTTMGWCILLNVNYAYPGVYSRSGGCPVRCIAE